MQEKINILRKKLINLGFSPGPIDYSTYHIYMVKLKQLEEMERKIDDTFNQKNENESPKEVTVVINNNGFSSTILVNLLILLIIYIIYLKWQVNSTDLLVV